MFPSRPWEAPRALWLLPRVTVRRIAAEVTVTCCGVTVVMKINGQAAFLLEL